MSASDRARSRVWVVRHTAVVLVLSAAVFLQEPGRTAADTKLDLTENPWGLLSRALHLWEPLGFFGQVQNQAYGYFFPMGPFFGALHSAGVPPWVVQRLWWSLLLVAAYAGAGLVARRLVGVTSFGVMAAGLAYALSPRLLTVAPPVSAEILPMVVLPWVLLPLLHQERLGTRRAAGLSALAVLFCGGVNAAAVLAVLPVPLLYLLTRAAGPARRRLLGAWSGAVLLASLWWLVPLLLLGRLSPPFLDWIENASVTTSITSPVTAIRGTSHWVAYLTGLGGPEWRGGWLLIAEPAFVLDTMLVAALGLAGLALPRCRERLFLLGCLTLGLLAVTFGHVAPMDGLGSAVARDLLDGPLAPFRNVHKFDAIVRLPLSVGVGVAVTGAARAWRARPHERVRDTESLQVRRSLVVGVAGLCVLALAGTAAPLLSQQFVQRGSWEDVPSYWQDAGDWLADHSDGTRSLVVPGASFSDSYWGRTKDEPLQAQGDVIWAVRDAVPLAPAGTIRWLDAVQRRLANGTTSPGLADALARAGVRYLVVRNDLDYAVASAPRPVLVHQAIDHSGGLVRVQTFGPFIGGGSSPELFVDRQLDRPYPAVEVYEVQRVVARAVLAPGMPEQVAAGPEGILDLLDGGLPVAAATVLSAGLDASIVTDTPRNREVGMGRVDDSWSATLSQDEPRRLDTPEQDYRSAAATPGLAQAEPSGVAVSASSSDSDADTPGGARPEHQPFAAVDGDLATSWVSQPGRGAVGQWLEFMWPQERNVSGATLRLDTLSGVPPTRLEVTTDRGSMSIVVPKGGASAFKLPVPAGKTSHLRITATAASDGEGFVLAISELRLPGLVAERPIRVASTSTAARVVSLVAPLGWRAGCVLVGDRPLCSPDLPRPGEEDVGLDRIVGPVPTGTTTATMVPNPSAQLDAWVTRGARVRVSASSTAVRDPSGAAYSVLDGDLGTGWVASSVDARPTLTFAYATTQTLRAVQVVVDQALAASRPTGVVIRAGGRSEVADLDTTGVATLATPLQGTSFSIELRGFPTVRTVDPYTRAVTPVPLGASELRLVGASGRGVPSDATPIVVDCGSGPVLTVDGAVVPLRISTTVGELRTLTPVDAMPCSSIPETSGPTRLTLRSVPGLRATAVRMVAPEILSATPSVPVAQVSWDSTHRVVAVPARTSVATLVVHENTSTGWRATLGDRHLEAVVVDGWQQGWIVPPGEAGTITLTFAPDGVYRLGLLGGLGGALLILLMAVIPGRRPAELVSPGRWPRPFLGAALVIAALLTVGLLGAGTAVFAWLLGRALSRAHPLAPAASSAASAAAAGVLLAMGPWGSYKPYEGNEALPQLLVAVAVALSVAGGKSVARTGTRPRRRWTGRSTT